MTQTLGRNIVLPIYVDVEGTPTPFHDLVLRKFTTDGVVMSLSQKITGDVYYKDNSLQLSMQEYVEYDGIKYYVVNPPTVQREGMTKDNSDLKGMTKYSFEFYHPMWILGNFPFADVAVSSDQKHYLSEKKTFSWVGNIVDFVAKLNKNLTHTEWVVAINYEAITDPAKLTQLSDVLSFDNSYINDALKTAYDTWGLPFIIDKLEPDEYSYVDVNNNTIDYYDEGKRFVIVFGQPANEIYNTPTYAATTNQSTGSSYYDAKLITLHAGDRLTFKEFASGVSPSLFDENFNSLLFDLQTMTYTAMGDINVYVGSNTNNATVTVIYGNFDTPFVFQFGQGVGLKNNSRNPRNNKIVTRISGYGSEDNIPYGYPQVRWYGDSRWDFTEYEGSTIHYDSEGKVTNTPKPGAYPLYMGILGGEYVKLIKHPFTRTHLMPPIFYSTLFNKISPYVPGGGANPNYDPDIDLVDYYDAVGSIYPNQINVNAPSYEIHGFEDIKPELGDKRLISVVPLQPDAETPAEDWDDTMDEDGNYLQSYFRVTLPELGFDLYACAAITQEMQLNMRSGACIGCTFPVQVDWDDYKANFYDSEGNFAPTGSQRNYVKFPDSTNNSISLVLQKEYSTFGVLMPNIYQQPKGETSTGADDGDKFVILGISLPETYITTAETNLESQMKTYMQENNRYYYDYPLKFDEFFLATHLHLLAQIRPNSVIRFSYAGSTIQLYVKQLTVKYGNSPLPEYDITLTDNIDVVLNQIGQVAEGLTQLGTRISQLQSLYGKDALQSLLNAINEKLSREYRDVAKGFISFVQGIGIGNSDAYGISSQGEAVLNALTANGVVSTQVKSNDFVSGDSYSGGRGFGMTNNPSTHISNLEVDNLLVRMKAVFTELEIRKLSAVGGNIVLSAAAGTIMDVEGEQGTYKIHLNNDDGTMSTQNGWVANDIVRCQTFNVESGTSYGVSNKNFFGYVVSTGEDQKGKYIIVNQALEIGTAGELAKGDVIVQMGNRDINTGRNSVIILATSGSNAPSISQYQGVIGYNLAPYLVTQISPQGNVFRAKSFDVQTASGDVFRMALDRGAYDSSATYNYYDRVSYNGSLWLYINATSASGQTPTPDNTDYWEQQVARGTDGANANTLSCFFSQASFVVPANADGTPDSTFLQDVTYHIYQGGQEVSTAWFAAVSECIGATAWLNQSTQQVALSNFTGDGKCTLEFRNPNSSQILYATVGFVVIKGGVDALTLHTEDATFARILNYGTTAYTSILPLTTKARLYRGTQNISLASGTVWSVVSEETVGCTASLSAETDCEVLTISALSADDAFVTISVASGGITLKRRIDIAVTRNGQRGEPGEPGGQGEPGEQGPPGDNGDDAYSCVLSPSSGVIGMDYNEGSSKIKITAVMYRGLFPIDNSSILYSATVDSHCVIRVENGQYGGVTIEQITNFSEGFSFNITAQYREKTFVLPFRYEVVTVGFKARGTEAYMYAQYPDANGNVHQAKVGALVEQSGETVVKMMADQINLEGYTTINGNTKIDAQGNLITKNATLEGYLRTSVIANWQQVPLGDQTLIIRDNLNVMLASYANTNVYLPCDPEYIGSRVVIIAPTNISAHNGELINNPANYLAKIYAGHVYVNHTYKQSAGEDDENLWFDHNRDSQLNKVKAAFGNGAVGQSYQNWFIGTKATFGNSYYCANEIVLQNGMIELLGVPSFYQSDMYITQHKYELDENGCLILRGGNPVQLPEEDARKNEQVTLCQWAVINVQADYIEYNAVNK